HGCQRDVGDLRAHRGEHLVGRGMLRVAAKKAIDRGSLLGESLTVGFERFAKDAFGSLIVDGNGSHVNPCPYSDASDRRSPAARAAARPHVANTARSGTYLANCRTDHSRCQPKTGLRGSGPTAHFVRVFAL